MAAPSTTQLLHSATRVLTFAIGKGGAGKTSLCSNLGVIFAQAGYKVLIVVLDPQDNIGEDLGYTRQGLGDDGQALRSSLIDGAALQPALTDVRPGLDIVTSGPLAGEDLLVDLRTNDIPDDRLAEALLPLANTYDFILIDSPPFATTIQRQALAAAQWLIVPTGADASSMKGIKLVAHEYARARQINDDLSLLGFVLFDVDTSAKRARQEVRTFLEEQLDGLAPVMSASIRHSMVSARACREHGLTAVELAPMVQSRLQVLKGKVAGNGVPDSAKNLADDYMSLAREVLGAIALSEARA